MLSEIPEESYWNIPEQYKVCRIFASSVPYLENTGLNWNIYVSQATILLLNFKILLILRKSTLVQFKI